MKRPRTAAAGGDPLRELQVLLGGAALLYVAWSWMNFSGAFQLLVDLQIDRFHDYSEAAAGIALALAMAAATAFAMALLGRAWPSPSRAAAKAIVAIVFAGASVAALGQAWQLWREAARMPRRSDALQVVDLGTLGPALPPTGHVRLIGVPDLDRQVVIRSRGRRGIGGYWEAWVPVGARRQQGGAVPVRIVATHRGADRDTVARAVTDDPEGLLLLGTVDTRTVYEARRQGLELSRPALVLYPDEDARFDGFINAVLLGSFALLFWSLAAWQRITGRRIGAAPVAAPSLRPGGPGAAPPVAADGASASPSTERAAAPESALCRFAMGGAVAALLAAALLWEWFGFFPDRIGRWGYAASAMTLVASLLLLWLGRRGEPAAASGTPLALPLESARALEPPPGAALLCVLRHEPGFSSPSYKRVDVDGARVAVLKANQYTVVALRPGTHVLAVNTRVSLASDTVERFEVAAGDVVIYRLEVPTFGRLRLARTADAAAVRAVLKRLKPVVPSSGA